MSETKRDISERYRRLEQKYKRKPQDPGIENQTNKQTLESLSLQTALTLFGQRITNGGFETGAFPPWTIYGVPDPPQIGTTFTHSGTYAARFPAGNLLWVQQMFNPSIQTSSMSEFYVWCYGYGGNYLSVWIIHDSGQVSEIEFSIIPQVQWLKKDILAAIIDAGGINWYIEGVKIGIQYVSEVWIDDVSLKAGTQY